MPIKSGSIIYDLAAIQGGNTAFTEVDKIVDKNECYYCPNAKNYVPIPRSDKTLTFSMAKAKGGFGSERVTKAKKKTRQGQGRGTKFSTRVGSKRFKKKYRGQGR